MFASVKLCRVNSMYNDYYIGNNFAQSYARKRNVNAVYKIYRYQDVLKIVSRWWRKSRERPLIHLIKRISHSE